LVEDEATVKTLYRRGTQYYLEPANPNYHPILVDEKVSIIGKVISVIRRF
jgi:repressor LexA